MMNDQFVLAMHHVAKCFDVECDTIWLLRKFDMSYIMYHILHGGYVLQLHILWSNMIFHIVLHTYNIVAYKIPSYPTA